MCVWGGAAGVRGAAGMARMHSSCQCARLLSFHPMHACAPGLCGPGVCEVAPHVAVRRCRARVAQRGGRRGAVPVLRRAHVLMRRTRSLAWSLFMISRNRVNASGAAAPESSMLAVGCC